MSQKPITFADEIDFFEGFNCRPKNMFEALTDEKMVSGYTFGPAKIEAKEGGAFSMFGGTVEGTFVSLVSGCALCTLAVSPARPHTPDPRL